MKELENENADRAVDLQKAQINAQSKVAVANINAQEKEAGRLSNMYLNLFKNVSPNQVQQ